jgi:hypothetical protein
MRQGGSFSHGHQPETLIAELIHHLIISEISFQEDITPSIARVLYVEIGQKAYGGPSLSLWLALTGRLVTGLRQRPDRALGSERAKG